MSPPPSKTQITWGLGEVEAMLSIRAALRIHILFQEGTKP